MIKQLFVLTFSVSLIMSVPNAWAQEDPEDPGDVTSAAEYSLIAAITRLDETVADKLDCEGAPSIEKYSQDVTAAMKKTLKANLAAARFNGLAPRDLTQAMKDEAQFLVEDCDLLRSGGDPSDGTDDSTDF